MKLEKIQPVSYRNSKKFSLIHTETQKVEYDRKTQKEYDHSDSFPFKLRGKKCILIKAYLMNGLIKQFEL